MNQAKQQKKITHMQLLIDSLIHPKKLAAYRLLPIGKVIQYTFLLVAIVTLFSFGRFTAGVSVDTFNMDGLTEYLDDVKWLLYPFTLLMLFVFTTMLIFVQIALYALAGLFFLMLLNRRGEYRHLWRTTTFAITWSTILSIVYTFLSIDTTIPTLLSMFITLGIIMIACTKYPKKPIVK